MNTMGKRIEFFRKKKGLTQKDLADKLNLKNSGTVSAWEVDTTSPKPTMMLELCKVLDITISELFGVEEETGLTKEENSIITSYKDLTDEGQKQAKLFFELLGYKYNKKIDWGRTKGS